MKELPSGKNVIPFYTVGKLSSNTLLNYFTDPPSEMGITLIATLDKQGENKNKITAIHLQSTASDENLFKFPRCLSVCPINVEIIQADGTVVETKTSYSRPNVFKMELEDLVLRDLLKANNAIRMRVPFHEIIKTPPLSGLILIFGLYQQIVGIYNDFKLRSIFFAE